MADTENSLLSTQGIPEVELIVDVMGAPVIEQQVEVFGMVETAVDKTLTIPDCAADAKATGDAIADLGADISDINEELAKKIESVPDMEGATEQEAGAAGLAPAPAAGDQGKYLRADGTWAYVPDMMGATALLDGASGLAPAPVAGQQGRFLRADGTWADVPDPQVMTGATAQAAGTSGLTPVPAAGDATRYLRSDGTWAVPPDTHVAVDSALDSTSTNPVQNSVVTAEFASTVRGDMTVEQVKAL